MQAWNISLLTDPTRRRRVLFWEVVGVGACLGAGENDLPIILYRSRDTKFS